MTEQPDTSDKADDETWTEYWDRKRIERHGTECDCPVCRLARTGIGDDLARRVLDSTLRGRRS